MMNMPKIIECDATECAYNTDKKCHALAITVGGGMDHKCDTFMKSSSKGGDMEAIGCVGACRSASCMNNRSLECQAPEIKVGHQKKEVDCLSFCTR